MSLAEACPWLRHYGKVPATLAYPAVTLYKWSCPREIEFRAELPKTQIGKIDYKVLARPQA